MATQLDSIDISKVRDYALELNELDLPEHEFDVSPIPGASTDGQAKTVHTNSDRALRKYSTKLPLKDGPNGREGTSGQNQRSRPSASPSQLPSTIPESIAARTAAMASQSEGDTQPLSQGVREEFASKIREHHAGLQSEATGESGTTWISASHSYQPVETGQIDLLADFEQPTGNDNQDFVEAVDDDIEPDSQLADVCVELFPESRRFQQPITPAAASRKRQRVESSASHANTTPRLPVNPFAGQPGGLDGMMDASQAFKATQFTSPLPNGVPSDALSDRPSPDLFNAQRPSTADPISSPVRLPRSRMARAVTEPQTTYISVEESQKERERRKIESEMAQAAAAQDASDNDSSEESNCRRRRIRRKIELESHDVLASITARARSAPNRRGRGGRKHQTPHTTSIRKSNRPERDPVIISDDLDADDNITEDETEKEDENNGISDIDSPDELTEENKENFDGKDLQISNPASRNNLRRAPTNAIDATPVHRPSRYPAIISNDHPEVISENSHTSTEEVPAGTATEAIADSQPPSPTHDDPASRLSRERIEIRQSSVDRRVFVPQSQWSASSTANPSRTGIPGSEEPTCVPASSTSPSLQRRTLESQQDEKLSDPPPSEELSIGLPEPFKSTCPPMDPVAMRSSPPQLEAALGVPVNDKTTDVGIISAAPYTMNREVPEPRHDVSLPVGNLTSSMHGENLQHTRSPQKSNQPRISRTVPDTSSAEINPEPTSVSSAPPASTHTSSRPDVRMASVTTDEAGSGPSTLFDTAPTQMTNTPHKSSGSKMPRRARRVTVTPSPKSTRPMTMLEIANVTSPPNPMNNMDIDVNLMTAEDMEFQAVVNGSSPVRPARKRRRGRMGRVVDVEEPETDKQPTVPASALNGPEANHETMESIVPAKDQLSIPRTAVKTLVSSPANGVAKGVTKSRIPEGSASRKRGRGKNLSLSAITVVEREAASDGDKNGSKNTFRANLPRVPTTSEPHIVDESGLSTPPVVAPNQVFAHFNGNPAAFYPATCIGLVGGKDPQYRVRFDDGTVDVINAFGIKRLELRPGDNVKLEVGGSRKSTYVVIKMQDRQQPMLTPDPETPTRHSLPRQASTAETTLTDINGYVTVVVSLKQANGINQQNNQSLTVPVRDIYFTQSMWTSLKDRAYTYTPVRTHLASRLETPLERSPIPSTPSSRAQRNKNSGLGVSRSAKPHSTVRSTLFENMVFAVTNIADPTARAALNSSINTHGGRLLSEDFSDLFNIPSLGPFSPSKRSPKRDIDPTFHLSTAASRMGFTCLIADKHCRMAKYIQALALGVPCLSSRWVQDCVAKQTILAWEPYLLAAGESTFLNGAVRSRILPSYDPITVTLPEIFEARPKPLDNASVLLIMEKSEEDTMRSHPLLSHALGARKVSRANNLDAAAKMLAEAQTNGDTWNWVYSHDKEEKVEKVLFGRGRVSSSGVGKKRKRGSSSMSRASGGEASKTRVVGNEFVIQSLILGRLISTD